MAGISSIDSGFLKRAAELVVQYIDREHFSGMELAYHLHLSREQTHRKLKNIPAFLPINSSGTFGC